MSTRHLTEAQIKLLSKGPKFCPVTKGNYLDIKTDIKDFTRKMKLQEHFKEESFTDNSYVKKKSIYTPQIKNTDLSKIIESLEKCEPIEKVSTDNLTKSERQALNELKDDSEIIIIKADKGNVLIIMSKSFYRDKLVVNDHLNTPTYSKTEQNIDQKVVKNMKILMEKHKKCLTKKEFEYITNFDYKSSNMYVLPKIHKSEKIIKVMEETNDFYVKMNPPPDLKGRPIISGQNSPTSHLSELIQKIISPTVPYFKSYIKDDWDFIRKLPKTFDFPCKLYSCDIKSLYTNITHELGLKALDYWINKHRNKIEKRFTTNFIIESAEFILKNNNFCFDNQFYHQEIGAAMGTDFAPPYANISVGYLEETKLYDELSKHFDKMICDIIMEFYFRFMDDGFLPWPTEVDIKIFHDIINNLDPNLEFTIEPPLEFEESDHSKSQKLNFLDIDIIKRSDGKIETDVYYKKTNSHDYLNYNSHHPTHIKNNLPYNLAKRLIVFCSTSEKETKRLKELRTWLLDCHYPPHVIDKGFFNARLQGPAPQPKESKNITFVTTFYSNYNQHNIIRTYNNLINNTRNANIKNTFHNTNAILTLRQPKNLLRILTSSRFDSTKTPKRLGLFRCKDKRCLICRNN